MLDLAKKEDVDALRWACAAINGPLPLARGLYISESLRRAPSDTHREAIRAISSPSASAQLVRDLLGACGLTGLDVYPHDGGLWVQWSCSTCDDKIGVTDCECEPCADGHVVPPTAIPALVLALLDALTLPEGRAEAALKTLREARR